MIEFEDKNGFTVGKLFSGETIKLNEDGRVKVVYGDESKGKFVLFSREDFATIIQKRHEIKD